MPQLLVDLNTGHNIIATVLEECRSMYRTEAPNRSPHPRREVNCHDHVGRNEKST
jgi:hypothetical protein